MLKSVTARHPADLESLLEAVRPFRDRVASHSVYESLKTPERVRLFMENHVFAVWDFMSLVKSLQAALTCTAVPWVPQGDAVSRRLINEITLDEESDEDGRGGYASHFELYLQAMEQCGADTLPIRDFLKKIQESTSVLEALRLCPVPQAARSFVQTTWGIMKSGYPHRIAAAFAIGREEIVPEMFQIVIRNIHERFPGQMERLAYYLKRHINIDKERHWPMAMRMLEVLCGRDKNRWLEAAEAARTALKARIQLWDGVQRRIDLLRLREPIPVLC
ncbi:MAG: DUF3050 domain-containing protein [Elusimicrobia bacterium]|nr:DUF3050 domain-containing protein [Elusimicrobiota bacterium]